MLLCTLKHAASSSRRSFPNAPWPGPAPAVPRLDVGADTGRRSSSSSSSRDGMPAAPPASPAGLRLQQHSGREPDMGCSLPHPPPGAQRRYSGASPLPVVPRSRPWHYLSGSSTSRVLACARSTPACVVCFEYDLSGGHAVLSCQYIDATNECGAHVQRDVCP
jgi:hypothetical protein